MTTQAGTRAKAGGSPLPLRARFLLMDRIVSFRTLANSVFQPKIRLPVAQQSPRGVPPFHTLRWGVVLAALAASQLGGCQSGSDCHIPEARCDDNVALNCKIAVDVKGKSTIFQEDDCHAGTCQIDDQGAFCAAGHGPDPACNGGNDPVCEGSVVTGCRNGYASSSYDCALNPRAGVGNSFTPLVNKGQFCVTSNEPDALSGSNTRRAFCALEADPVAVCKDVPYRSPDPESECDGDDLVACFYGYVLSRDTCGAGLCSAATRVGKCL